MLFDEENILGKFSGIDGEKLWNIFERVSFEKFVVRNFLFLRTFRRIGNGEEFRMVWKNVEECRRNWKSLEEFGRFNKMCY